MKIIKKGRDPSKDILHVKCKQCGTVHELLRSDSCINYPAANNFRDEDCGPSITCILCSAWVYLRTLDEHVVGNDEFVKRLEKDPFNTIPDTRDPY